MMSMAAVMLLALASCHKDKINYEDGDKNKKENIGYLSIAGMEAKVLVETENINGSSDNTRAEGDVDVNNFDVVILRETGINEETQQPIYGEVAHECKFSTLAGENVEPLALDAGNYLFTMTSAEMQGVAWDRPVYGAERTFSIKRLETTTLDSIVCKMSNIKVSISYSADIIDQLDANLTTMTAAIGENSEVFSMSETRSAYFQPEGETSTLKLTLNCRYKNSDKDIIMTSEIKDVKAAQWRKIHVSIQHASDGTATIGIVCDTWTYDEDITFDSASLLVEEILVDDTDMPEIKWEGHDLAEPFELSDDYFNEDGEFTSSINLDVTSKSAIKSLVINVSSDSDEFNTAYAGIVPLELDLCSTKLSSAILNIMGYSAVGEDQTYVQLKFGKQAANLMKLEGTHTYDITVEDANGRKTTATLTIASGNSDKPKIKWVGYNIDERQTYSAEMTCDLKITAPLAIEDFMVEIISATLTAEQLTGVGLANEFSLVTSTEYFGALSGYPYREEGEAGDPADEGLGFPVGDEVKGKTELDLSITNFLSVLKMLGAGDHDFKMTVTDTEGNKIEKTVMMHFE